MRFRSRSYYKDDVGTQCVIKKFLLLPRRLGSKHWRWLEYAYIVYEICEVDIGGSMEWGKYAYQWREVGFADEMKQLADGAYLTDSLKEDK